MKKTSLFLAIVLVTGFFACQKDIVTAIQPSTVKANFMNIDKAKEWFDETEPKTVWTKNEKQEHYKPQWDLAVQLNGVVEVPVLLENKVIKPTINVDNPKLHGVTRLLIASLDGHTIDAAIIKYFPTEKFVGNIEEINRDNFREKKFDGMIKLENFDFTDQKVVLIENGELTNFMGKNLKHDPNKEDYTVCFQNSVCQSVSVPNAGYYGPTTCSFDGSYYCITVPTDYNNNGNTNTSGSSSSATGMNNSGAGILGGGTITAYKKLCDESLVELRSFPPTTNEPYETQKTGLVNVNIEFTRPFTLDVYQVNFDYLIFVINHNADPIADAYTKIATAFNQAITNTQRDIQLSYTPPGSSIIYDGESAGKRFLSYLSIELTGNLGCLAEAKAQTINPNIGLSNPFSSERVPMSTVQTKDTRVANAQCEE